MRRIRPLRRLQSNTGAGLFFGSVLLLVGLGLLWFNEGRTNLANLAARSTAVDGSQPTSVTEGEFVSVTGWLTSPGTLGDDRFLRSGDYVYLERLVEMYAWVEKGSGAIQEDNTPDSRYQLEWTSSPQPAIEFEVSQGHENPPLPVEPLVLTAAEAYVGLYALDAARLDWPRRQPLTLEAGQVVEGNYRVMPETIYLGAGMPDAPLLGDVRISYWVVYENIWVTVLGQMGNGRVLPYPIENDQRFYRLLEGDRATALAQLEAEHKTLLWGFRGGGVVALWLGFLLLLSPLSQLLAFFPALQRLSSRVLGLVALLLALVLGASTSLVSAILHNGWAALLLFLLLGGSIVVWQRQRPANR